MEEVRTAPDGVEDPPRLELLVPVGDEKRDGVGVRERDGGTADLAEDLVAIGHAGARCRARSNGVRGARLRVEGHASAR